MLDVSSAENERCKTRSLEDSMSSWLAVLGKIIGGGLPGRRAGGTGKLAVDMVSWLKLCCESREILEYVFEMRKFTG